MPLIWDFVRFENDKLAGLRSLLYIISLLMFFYISINYIDIESESILGTLFNIILFIGIIFGMLFLFVWLVVSPTWIDKNNEYEGGYEMPLQLKNGVWVCTECGFEGKPGYEYGACPNCDPDNHESFVNMVTG